MDRIRDFRNRTPPSLAILIPTYNRRDLLKNTLLTHCGIIEDQMISNVQVVVSNNYSSDGTAEMVRTIAKRYPFVSLVDQPRHYSTGEEHIYYACKAIDHEYVWMFGDDDLPLPNGLRRILEVVRTRRYDFIATNMRSLMNATLSIHPGRNDLQGIVFDTEDGERDMFELVADLGFQSVIACVSAVAFHREKFLSGGFLTYFEASPIYSHVATYLEAFRDSRCYYIGEPVLDYRQGATRMSNWERFSAQQRKAVLAPWTLGVVRLFRMLREGGHIPPTLLFKVREHTPDNVYVLWHHILSVLGKMIQESLDGGSPASLLSDSELTEIVDEFAECLVEAKAADSAIRLVRVARIARAALTDYRDVTLDNPSGRPVGGHSLPWLLENLDPTVRDETVTLVSDWCRREIGRIQTNLN